MSYMEISNLEKSFDKNEVLKNISLTIEQGEFVSLLGPSGCGKSTLLRCLSGLETIDGGTFLLDGKVLRKHLPRPETSEWSFSSTLSSRT